MFNTWGLGILRYSGFGVVGSSSGGPRLWDFECAKQQAAVKIASCVIPTLAPKACSITSLL